MVGKAKSPISGALRSISVIAVLLGLAGCGGSDSTARRDACGAKVRATDAATRLTYRTAADVVADVPILCDRLRALKIEHEVLGAGRDRLVIAVASKDVEAAQAVAQTGQLSFYDWEANVLAPNGKPAPLNAKVTGGSAAGRRGAMPLYYAVELASTRPANPESNNARRGAVFYAVDTTANTVYGTGQGGATRYGAATEAAARAAVPAAERKAATIYAVPSGTVVVRAEPQPDAKADADAWYVLRDDVALGNAQIKQARQGLATPAGGAGEPIVTFEFTGDGAKAFARLTRELARRGSRTVGLAPGTTPADANQHLAIVVDDRIVAVPFIDFRANPDGIDGSTGSQIQGGFTIASAKQLATVLGSGPLPVPLEPVAAAPVSP